METFERRVDFSDTDAGGVVHFSRFFAFMEAAEDRYLRSLGASLKHGPNGWGWFFVPCANLFMPYRAVVELYTAGRPGAPTPGLFPLWWATWLISNFIANIETRMSLSDDVSTVRSSIYVSMVSSIAALAAAFVARKVVLAVYEALEGDR